MKFRKSRHFRKQVKFYQIHYGYHSPAVLILDGNFLKIAVEKQMDIQFQFERYSKMKCSPKITQCALLELNELRSMFPGVYAAAKKYPIIRCGHITGVPPHECIFDLVKQKPSKDPANPNQYYWVLTQDETLRDKLADLEHVPITYLSAQNMLILMEPAHYLKRKLEQIEFDKFLPSQREYRLIAPVLKEQRKSEKAKRLAKLKKQRDQGQVKMKKPALGPNPKSMMRRSMKIKKVRKRRHKMKHRKHKPRSEAPNI